MRLRWVIVSVCFVAAVIAAVAFLTRGLAQTRTEGADPVPLNVMRAERGRDADKVAKLAIVDKPMQSTAVAVNGFEVFGLAINLQLPVRPDSVEFRLFRNDFVKGDEVALEVEDDVASATYRPDQTPTTTQPLSGASVSFSGKTVGMTDSKPRVIRIERIAHRPLVFQASFGTINLTLTEDHETYADVSLSASPKSLRETAVKMIEHRLDSQQASVAIDEASARLEKLPSENRLLRFLSIDADTLMKPQPVSELAENTILALWRTHFLPGTDVTRVSTEQGKLYAYHAGWDGMYQIILIWLDGEGKVIMTGSISRKERSQTDDLRAFLNGVKWRLPNQKE